MVNDEVQWLGKKAQELLESYKSESPAHKLCTFEDVEILWESVVRPELDKFETMQDTWASDAEVPRSSMWHANWKIPNRG